MSQYNFFQKKKYNEKFKQLLYNKNPSTSTGIMSDTNNNNNNNNRDSNCDCKYNDQSLDTMSKSQLIQSYKELKSLYNQQLQETRKRKYECNQLNKNLSSSSNKRRKIVKPIKNKNSSKSVEFDFHDDCIQFDLPTQIPKQFKKSTSGNRKSHHLNHEQPYSHNQNGDRFDIKCNNNNNNNIQEIIHRIHTRDKYHIDHRPKIIRQNPTTSPDKETNNQIKIKKIKVIRNKIMAGLQIALTAHEAWHCILIKKKIWLIVRL